MKNEQQEKVVGRLMLFIVIMLTLLVLRLLYLSDQAYELDRKVETLKEELEKEKELAEEQVEAANEEIRLIHEELDRNAKLTKSSNLAIEELELFKDQYILDQETISQYSYIQKNDMTDELIMYGHTLMTNKGLDPNVLFAIIEIESKGISDAYNTQSGASGLGQFIPSSGRVVYEDMLQLGQYDHIRHSQNPRTNILMMATYLEYLYDTCGNNTSAVLQSYSGGADWYYTRVTDIIGYTP